VASIACVNGPNLNLLGRREPGIYGTATLDELVEEARTLATAAGFSLIDFASNHEGELVEWIQALPSECVALIANLGALTHYSYALADAVAARGVPTIELHISNPLSREEFRHTSVLAKVAAGAVFGFGGLGYRIAVLAAIELVRQRPGTGAAGIPG